MSAGDAGHAPGLERAACRFESEFCCLRCGTETGMTGRRRGPRRLCGPCSVTWTAARLLDDGTGAIAAPLKPLAEALAAVPYGECHARHRRADRANA
jgi:hypothetical protein